MRLGVSSPREPGQNCNPGTRQPQCPADDDNFRLVFELLELCALAFGPCEECPLRSVCIPTFDKLSERCQDRRLKAAEAFNFVFKFIGFRGNGNGQH